MDRARSDRTSESDRTIDSGQAINLRTLRRLTIALPVGFLLWRRNLG